MAMNRVWTVGVSLMVFLSPAAGVLAQGAPGDGDYSSFWSRVTLEAPVYTHHFPNDALFNDHNWGGFVDVAVTRQWSIVGGDFDNSYRRNTAFLAASYEPIEFTWSKMRLDIGGLAGVDLNGGYRHFNRLEPLLGAVNLRLSGHGLDPTRYGPLARAGLLATIIPPDPHGGSTAVNLAVTYRLN